MSNLNTKDRAQLDVEIRLAVNNNDHIFDYLGWDVRWSGWRTPFDQFIDLGFWMAFNWKSKRFLYATTTGSWGEAKNELDPIIYSVTPEIRREYPNFFILTAIDKKRLVEKAAWKLLAQIEEEAAKSTS